MRPAYLRATYDPTVGLFIIVAKVNGKETSVPMTPNRFREWVKGLTYPSVKVVSSEEDDDAWASVTFGDKAQFARLREYLELVIQSYDEAHP